MNEGDRRAGSAETAAGRCSKFRARPRMAKRVNLSPSLEASTLPSEMSLITGIGSLIGDTVMAVTECELQLPPRLSSSD